MARLAALLFPVLGVACFPYAEVFRPEIQGRVVVADGDAPIAGALVEACSGPKHTSFAEGCPRRASAVTGPSGEFHFPEHKETEWCCWGEAPLPVTFVSACAPDGRVGAATIEDRQDKKKVMMTLPVAPSPSRLAQPPSKRGFGDLVDPLERVRAACPAAKEQR